MAVVVGTNVASLKAQNEIRKVGMAQEKTLAKLSSGDRIRTSSDDAAGLAISENLKADIRSFRQAERNTTDAVSTVQVAEGGLNEVSNVLIRMRELAIQSASDTISDSEREMTNMEYQALGSEIDRISKATEFNGKKLLSGTEDALDIQVGIHNSAETERLSINLDNISSGLESLGLEGASVSTKEASGDVLARVDQAIERVSSSRAYLGSTQNRLESIGRSTANIQENLSAANSRIRDTDYALEAAENAKLSILNSAATSVASQANAMPQAALKLVG